MSGGEFGVKPKPGRKRPDATEVGDCFDCAYMSYDDDWGWECSAYMDEDEVARLMASGTGGCPYYRKYDEYGMVRKQN